ncbi:hypothetical protein A5645_08530 [Mycobacterium asiaticum]|uniref:GNAT family N-acetyltransferase n=1 Tax=Mycobacterium asiaticum TaxID=1790 RepID=UPI0007F02E53|nr:GNAT family N-acetyltransferase [Mycobacterium asiaticum]OBK96476.1 hypothetical protein A5645_08530 [Mycobacterium asiaticum]
MIVERYDASYRSVWDSFVQNSKNGFFLFERGYMDYHSHRFSDHSLLIYDEKDNLIALLPANQHDDALVSHGGLTYGGLITDKRMKAQRMLNIFDELRIYCSNHGIRGITYKAIPYIYHRLPADEDRYGLYINGARLTSRQVTSVIDQSAGLPFQQGRIGGVKKAARAGVQVSESHDLAGYWTLLDKVLWTTHGAHPVHSLSEIVLLCQRFPSNIRLYTAGAGSEIDAGVLMYVSDAVARTQYVAANERGKALGALDLLFDHLINDIYARKRYFDFGTSHDPSEGGLNSGLISQKEAFGARAVVVDTYRVTI